MGSGGEVAKARSIIEAQRIEPVIGEAPAQEIRAEYRREMSGKRSGRAWIVVAVLLLLLGGAGIYWYLSLAAPSPLPAAAGLFICRAKRI